jgi:DNA-binding NtrC family response regulator
MTKIDALFAFVDLKDPFMAGEIAGEDLPGPILSIMSAKQFRDLFLFHTPHTRENAYATEKEVSSRYPDCHILVRELPVSDPKDYSSIMGRLARMVPGLIKQQTSQFADHYVCISSGTAEMRAAWFLLTTLGIVRAKLLQVGSPSEPLFGKINVKELRIGTSNWETIRELAMPAEYFVECLTPGEASKDKVAGDAPKMHPIEERGLTLSQWPSEITAFIRKTTLDQVVKGAPPETKEQHALGDTKDLKALQCQTTTTQIERETLSVPGLDDALQELGIYVGSAVLRHAAERAGIAAGSDLPVLVLGETGTGKEQFARLIHRMSPRGSRELVPINCAAIPESIAEDYLFGHMKGAFSGAHSDKKGMFECADQGTLFLDEIAELTLEVQAKLLRVIQDGVIQRLGSTASRKVDVRIIAASNRDLRNEVSAGRFREDLYFRLEVVEIKLPALRERRSEIPELALALLRRINLRRSKPRQLSSEALLRLERYDWPGNVRELSNVLERSVLYARGDVIQAEALHITEDPPPKDPLATLPESCRGFKLDEYLAHLREQLIVRALTARNGNQTEAAKLLGISKQAVSKSVARQRELTSRKP